MFLAGRYDDVARHNVLPFRIKLAGTDLTIDTKDDVTLFLHRLRVTLIANGIAALRPDITAISLPGPDRRVWVRWHAVNASGAIVSVAQCHYLLVHRDGVLQVAETSHATLLLPEMAKASTRRRLMP